MVHDREDLKHNTMVMQVRRRKQAYRCAFPNGRWCDADIIAANQSLADRNRFELSDEKWLAFQAALDQPVSAKPKLKKLMSEPGLLD